MARVSSSKFVFHFASSNEKHLSGNDNDKQDVRDLSVGPPPSPPPHRTHLESKRPPRLSISFHRSTSASTLDSSSDSLSPSPLLTPVSPAVRMKKRISTFLTGSTDLLQRRSSPRFPGVVRKKHDDGNAPPEQAPKDDITRSDASIAKVTGPGADHVVEVRISTLAQMVQAQLGTVVEDVDREIEQEWEHSRRVMRQSISIPHKSGLY